MNAQTKNIYVDFSQNRNYSEYFEEDVKGEIVDVDNGEYPCNLCEDKAIATKKAHIDSVHKKVKYPCM